MCERELSLPISSSGFRFSNVDKFEVQYGKYEKDEMLILIKIRFGIKNKKHVENNLEL